MDKDLHDIPCTRYHEREPCLAAGCDYYRAVCRDKGDHRQPCASFETQYDCQAAGCQFDFVDRLCKDPTIASAIVREDEQEALRPRVERAKRREERDCKVVCRCVCCVWLL